MKNSKKKRYAILIVIWLIFIWGHSMIPGDESSTESGVILEIINTVVESVGAQGLSMFAVRKLAHFTEYMILAVLVSLEYSQFYEDVRRKPYIPPIACWIVAFLDETIQLFSEGRAGMIQDVWIDFSGACLGVALTLLIIYNRNRNKHRRP